MSENKLLKFLAAHLGAALLSWFIAICLSLMIGILFLTESTINEVPTVLLNLWVITLLTIPVYAVVSFFPKKFIVMPVTGLTLVILSFLVNRGKFLHESGVFSFPEIQNLTYINSGSEREIDPADDLADPIEEIDAELELELPDEL